MPTTTNSLAVSPTDPAINVPAAVKDRPISKRLRKVIDLLLSGECKTQKAACNRIGMHPDHVCRELKKPQVQMFIAQESRKTISNGTMRASARLIELLDASSEHVSLDASKHVLAIEGIKPHESGTNISIINNVAPGYLIDVRTPTIEHEARSPSNEGTDANDIKGLGGDHG